MMSTPIALRWLPLSLIRLLERTLFITSRGDLRTCSAYPINLLALCSANQSLSRTHYYLFRAALVSGRTSALYDTISLLCENHKI